MSNSKYHHLQNGTYKIQKQHVDDIAQILARSFSAKNIVWASANAEYNKLKEFFVRTIEDHLAVQEKTKLLSGKDLYLNSFNIVNGQLIGCLLNFDIREYRQILKSREPSVLPIFKRLEEAGRQLLKDVDISSYQPGHCVYTNFGNHSTNNQTLQFPRAHGVINRYLFLKEQGYRYVFARVSNEKARKLYESIGGELLSSVPFEIGNNKLAPISLMRVDMENPTFLKLMDELKVIKNNQKNQKPKL